MIKSKKYKCERLLREIANEIIFSRKESQSIEYVILKRLKFSEVKFILDFWTAMDLLKNSEYSLEHFNKNELEKFEVGERWIRVYGILNLIYAQTKAIKTLSELSKNVNHRSEIIKLKKCKIHELRNKIASHSLDLLENGKICVQSLGQLNSGTSILTNSQFGGYIEYDLYKEIEHYNLCSTSVVINITNKFITTWLKNGGEKLKSMKTKIQIIESE